MSNHITDLVNGQEFESASPLAHAVRYDRAQVKTEEQKKQARENIGCYCEAGGGGGSSSGGGVLIVHESYNEETHVATLDKTAAEIYEAVNNGIAIWRTRYEDDEDEVVGSALFSNANRHSDGGYRFIAFSMALNPLNNHVVTNVYSYYADNDNDYPTTQAPNSGDSPDAPIIS